MAKKKTESIVAPQGPVLCCGDCVHATAFCCKGADGKAIFCRCAIGGDALRFITDRACREQFVRRTDPLPEDVPGLPAERLDGAGKVVPVFGDDPRTPIGYVPAQRLRHGCTVADVEREWSGDKQDGRL